MIALLMNTLCRIFQDEEKVRVGEVCGCYRALALTRRRAHEVDSSAATIVETRVRLTAIARRRTLVHRDQELIWVHAPRDLSVSMQKLCSFELTPAAKEAIIGAAYAPEDSRKDMFKYLLIASCTPAKSYLAAETEKLSAATRQMHMSV